MRRLPDFAVDVAAVGVAALLAIYAAGLLVNSSTAHRLDQVPLAGELVGGLRALVDTIYRPAAA